MSPNRLTRAFWLHQFARCYLMDRDMLALHGKTPDRKCIRATAWNGRYTRTGLRLHCTKLYYNILHVHYVFFCSSLDWHYHIYKQKALFVRNKRPLSISVTLCLDKRGN